MASKTDQQKALASLKESRMDLYEALLLCEHFIKEAIELVKSVASHQDYALGKYFKRLEDGFEPHTGTDFKRLADFVYEHYKKDPTANQLETVLKTFIFHCIEAAELYQEDCQISFVGEDIIILKCGDSTSCYYFGFPLPPEWKDYDDSPNIACFDALQELLRSVGCEEPLIGDLK